MPVLRYGKSVFTKEIQGIEFFVVDALLCKFWSTSKLCICRYLPATSSAPFFGCFLVDLSGTAHELMVPA